MHVVSLVTVPKTGSDLAMEQSREGAPELPFAGTVPTGQRPVWDADPNLVALAGRALLSSWRRGVSPQGVLLDGRTVLLMAAQMADPSIAEAVGLIGSHLGRLHDLNEQGIARLLKEISRFCQGLEAVGIEVLADIGRQDAEDFIDQAVVDTADRWGDPSVSTRYLRRSALRLFFRICRQLLLVEGDPTLDIVLPPRSARTTRPLGDDEEALGRIWAQPTLDGTRHRAAWALGQATGTSSELAAATIGDIDLDAGRVWLHGNDKKREPRWGQLTTWGLDSIERRLRSIGTDPDTPLVTAATASRNSRQASSCTAIQEVLTHAGLRNDRGVRPGSLPAWAGAHIHNTTGRIDEAAHALGVRSLDRAADIIGWTW